MHRHSARLVENDDVPAFIRDRHAERRIRFKLFIVLKSQDNDVAAPYGVNSPRGLAVAGDTALTPFQRGEESA